MCLSGVFIAIELKSETGKLSELQKYNMNMIAKCGGIAMIISPENEEESISFLTNISQELKDNTRIHELMT